MKEINDGSTIKAKWGETARDLNENFEELNSRTENVYRAGSSNIVGQTLVEFSSPFLEFNEDVYIQVISYTSGDTVISGGYSIGNINGSSFSFNPPTSYPNGVLIYRAEKFK